MIAVVAALEIELKPLRPLVSQEAVLLMRTGVGRANVEGAMRELGGSVLKALVNIGFCGALRDEIRPGELLLAEALIAEGRPVLRSDLKRLELAERALQSIGASYERGRLLTAERVVGHPRAKEELASRFGALAVDMEGYWIAEAAQARHLPFLALKVVLDGVSEELPFKELGWGHVLSARPWGLVGWGRRARTFASTLARATEAIILANS